MEHPRSEAHRKYLIQIHLYEMVYYLVWGTDMSDSEEQDKLLLDPQERILLFTRIEQIGETIARSEARLFDEANLVPWSGSLTDADVYTEYDLDYITSILFGDLKSEQILRSPDITHELINFINLFGDYVYQLDREELVKLCRTRQIRIFFDYCYDSYFWNTPPDELQTRQAKYLEAFRFGRFRGDMQRLLRAFVTHCHIVP